MDVLTLLQPYAWMVIYGSKDIENRGWTNRIIEGLVRDRRPFAVHAAAAVKRSYYLQAVDYAHSQDPELVVPSVEELMAFRGCIIGIVFPVRIFSPGEWTPERRWHMRGQYGWQLEQRTPLSRLVFATGRQGFWTISDDVLREAE